MVKAMATVTEIETLQPMQTGTPTIMMMLRAEIEALVLGMEVMVETMATIRARMLQ